MKNKKDYQYVSGNIYLRSNGKYRCIVELNGKRHQKLETNLKRAKAWVRVMKSGN